MLTPKCTRFRIQALWLSVFLTTSLASACDFDRFHRARAEATGCITDCVSVAPLSDGRSMVYPVLSPRLSHRHVSRSALEPLVGELREPPIPLRAQPLQPSGGYWPVGCRFGWIPMGLRHGLKPGVSVPIVLANRLQGALVILSAEDARAFGAYDVRELRLENSP